MPSSPSKVGILAYGSLIDDPGEEIRRVLVDTLRGIYTPFGVEFARSSRTRGGAPTLVPVSAGGACVAAAVLILDASSHDAADMLWRRETRTADVTRGYAEPPAGNMNRMKIETLPEFAGLELVLYTSLPSNIEPLTAGHLADLAIASVACAPFGLDGISYLMAAEANGIQTPLTGSYGREILLRTGTSSLAEALISLNRDAEV